MNETLARFRDVLVARMNVLEEEARLAEALYKERHGDYGYVTLENVALFERQIAAIDQVRRLFQEVDLDRFGSIQEFRDFARQALQELYDQRAILRCGVRMIIECLRDL